MYTHIYIYTYRYVYRYMYMYVYIYIWICMKKVVAPRRPNVHAEVSGSTWIGLHGTSMWNGPCAMHMGSKDSKI